MGSAGGNGGRGREVIEGKEGLNNSEFFQVEGEQRGRPHASECTGEAEDDLEREQSSTTADSKDEELNEEALCGTVESESKIFLPTRDELVADAWQHALGKPSLTSKREELAQKPTPKTLRALDFTAKPAGLTRKQRGKLLDLFQAGISGFLMNLYMQSRRSSGYLCDELQEVWTG